MSVQYKDIELLPEEDPTPNKSPTGNHPTSRGVAMNRWIPQPSSGLICSLSALCTGLLFIIIILIVTITRQGVDQTEQNMEVKLRNLSLGVDSRVEKLSQDDSRMMEKLTDIQTFIKDMKDSRMMEKLTDIQTFIKDMKDSRMMEKLTDIQTFIKDMKGQGVDQTEKNMEVMIRNLSLGLDSRVEKISQDDSRMMEKLTNIETFVKGMRGSYANDIQRVLGAVARLTEEIRKGNNSTDLLCDVGWGHYAFSCYYLSQYERTWESAKSDCETRGAHLVVINGKNENSFVGSFSKWQISWIGLTDADGSWKWVEGTSYDDTPKFWMPGQPDEWINPVDSQGEDCAELQSSGGWNDGHCSQEFVYICEKEMH